MANAAMINPHSEWLAQVNESVREPEIGICDAHHHLWDRSDNRYLMDDLERDAAGNNIVSSVFVECSASYRSSGPMSMRPVGETAYIDKLANLHQADPQSTIDCAAAIISFADLRLGEDAARVIQAHREASPDRFKGTRHGVGWDAHPDVPNSHTKPVKGLLMDRTFRQGVACLEAEDLIYECYLYFTQMQELADLARTFPTLRIVLNHFGGPIGVGPYTIKSKEMMDVWRKGIDDLAACPNVIAKLGGIAMPRNGFGWHLQAEPPTSIALAEATAPFYRYTIEKFTPARCMFESNYPVEKQSCSYTVLWNSFKRIVSDFSAEEKAEMFYGTAAKTYSLA
jgi:predicted TIM-barrel fold metal-dependent hydrolase